MQPQITFLSFIAKNGGKTAFDLLKVNNPKTLLELQIPDDDFKNAAKDCTDEQFEKSVNEFKNQTNMDNSSKETLVNLAKCYRAI
jgi:hypothetical protein